MDRERGPHSVARRVAIIGGGVFGSTAALGLADDGHQVTLFEHKRDILLGASKNNQNRLHLGFHYPRDPDTARQCREGFADFVRMFPECISGGFPNRYFVASSDSLTTPAEYLRFLDRVSLSYRIVPVEEAPVRNCDLAILSDEVVYDCDALREHLRRQLMNADTMVLRFAVDVTDISGPAPGYRLRLGEGSWTDAFDVVVNCSYDEINRLSLRLGHAVPDHQFEYTVIPIVEVEIPRQGITVMDGPFMTLLPYGSSSDFLLYHVAHTVIAREHAQTRPATWTDPATAPFAAVDKAAFFQRMQEACSEFVPAMATAKLKGFLEGPRMVLARRDHDDARPSVLTDHGDGYMTVFAGKIDHCIGVANDIRRRLGTAS